MSQLQLSGLQLCAPFRQEEKLRQQQAAAAGVKAPPAAGRGGPASGSAAAPAAHARPAAAAAAPAAKEGTAHERALKARVLLALPPHRHAGPGVRTRPAGLCA